MRNFSVNDPAETISAGSLTKIFYREVSPYHILTLNKKSWVILHLFSVSDFDDFRSEYLSEYEAISETTLARESGSHVGLIDEKPRGSKISCNCPFIRHWRLNTITAIVQITAVDVKNCVNMILNMKIL
jgi:hypothetical protein